jgi:hypothetical protein
MTVTLRELRDRLEEITDGQKSKHLSVPEKNRLIANGVTETWDKIISSGQSNQYVKNTVFSTVQGQLEYNTDSPLVVPDGDFYKVHQIYIDEGSGQMRPLPKLNAAEVQAFRAPQGVVSVKLYYIPKPPTFKDTNGAWDDAAGFDGINGFEEHSVVTAAMYLKQKKEDDYTFYRQRKAELEQRIADMSMDDYGEAPRIVRRRRRAQDPFMLFRNNVNGWLIRDGKIELYYHYGYVP